MDSRSPSPVVAIGVIALVLLAVGVYTVLITGADAGGISGPYIDVFAILALLLLFIVAGLLIFRRGG